jgi:hypothetical protein
MRLNLDVIRKNMILLEVSLVMTTMVDGFLARTDPGGYWWPPAYSTWTPTTVSFSVSLIVAQFTIFGNFLGPELPEPF